MSASIRSASHSVACPLCRQAAFRLLVRTDFNLTGAAATAYQVVECDHCQFRYLNPRPGSEELAECYGADYPIASLHGAAASAADASLRRRYDGIARQRLAILRRGGVNLRADLRVLDVGCGNGTFLQALAREPGVEAWGLDISAEALGRVADPDRRLQLVPGTLHDADLPEHHFDVVTLWHSLEHDGDPVGMLRRAGNLLKPGGLVVAEVPNSAGLIARLCGSAWLGWDLPRHLIHFTPTSLRQTAEAASLRDVHIRGHYTLNPVCLSPLLASLAIWLRRRKGKSRLKPVRYHKWDGLRGAFLRLINALEWALGSNGLLLTARPGTEERG